jgi:hypothetical protein
LVIILGGKMTVKYSWYMDLSGQVNQALYAHYGPMVQESMQEYGLEGPDVLLAQTAYAAEPEPITTEIILERSPYMASTAALNQMSDAAARGILMLAADGEYILTEKGRRFAKEVPEHLADLLRDLEPLKANESERLAELLRRLVEASLTEIEPARKAALSRSRFYDPGPNAPVLERIRRYLNDLNAFRDDVHMAAWRTYEIEGHEWEAFSHVCGEKVWGDDVSTAAEVAEKLAFRGYDEAEYVAALQSSVKRGWLQVSDGAYSPAEAGADLRRQAEAATDHRFFAPWRVLRPEEVAELRELMTRLGEALHVEE